MTDFNVNFILANDNKISGNFVLSAEDESLIADFLLDETDELSGLFTVDVTSTIEATFIHGTSPNIAAIFKIDYYPMKTSELDNDSGFITIADIPTKLSELEDDSTHRLVTDAEKSTWNDKQDAGDYATNTDLATKVDKIVGKGLSTVDFTDSNYVHTDNNFTNTLLSNLNNQSGTNTGDETETTIKSKLGITTLSGSNTGDQDLSSLATNTELSNHTTNTSNPHSVTKVQVGLDNVDNTSDLNKPISTATQTALNLKANDSAVVHKTGTESIAGAKTFTDIASFNCPSYPVTSHQRTASSGSSEVAVGRYVAQSNNTIVNGFGCHYDYCISDVNNNIAQLARVGAKRDGVNNGYGTIYLTTVNNYTVAEKFNILPSGHLIPYVDNVYNLGDATHRMGTIYAGTGTINTSDERQKEQIQSLSDDERLNLFFDSLRPVSYKFKDYSEKTKVIKLETGNNGEQIEKETKEDINHNFKRLHHGLIAQEVEQAMIDNNIDSTEFAGLIKDIDSDYYGLRYEEFIPMLIQQVQELKKQIRELKNGH